MRKIFSGVIIACIAVLAGAFFIAPSFISGQVSDKIQQKTHGDNVQANLETSPSFMLLFGKIDNLNLSADNILLDKINLNRLTIRGTDVDFSVTDLLLARRLVINSAQSLTIEGVIDEANLAKLLNEKIDNVSDITAAITPDSVEATGKFSLFGRESTVRVKGSFLIQDDNLIFRITNVDTKNSLLGHIGISMTRDIPVSGADSLPVENARFTKIEQQNGQILIEADADKIIQR